MRLVKTLAVLLFAFGTFTEGQAQIPAVKLKSIDGKIVDTSNLSNDGKPFIISFFATWCKPCNRELNAIHEVYPEWQEETGVRVIAIAVDDGQNTQKVKPMVDAAGWEYQVLLDPNSEFKRALGVSLIPHVFIFDGQGQLVEQHKGYTEGSEEELIHTVRKLTSK